MRKKIICALLASVCTLSSLNVYAKELHGDNVKNNIWDNFSVLGEEYDWGDENDETASPVKEEYQIALEKLRSIGVAGNESYTEFANGESLTRAEFISLAVRCTGLTEFTSDKQYFLDVDKNSTYAPYIAYATEIGFINGDGGLFRPDSKITYIEACTILVRVLGQKVPAEYANEWQTGYINAANDADITKRVSIKNYNDDALKGDLYIMLANALESNSYAEIRSSEGGYLNYETGRNLLEKYFNISTGDGIISAVGNTGAITDGRDNRVIIDDVEYDADYNDYIHLLGNRVEFWYETDEMRMVYASKKNNKNSSIVMDADDIIGYDGNRYKYSIGGATKYAVIAGNPVVIFNGRLATSDIKNLYQPDMGYVKLISNDGDSKYEYIIIESYRDYVVSSVDKDDMKIYDEYRNEEGKKETLSIKEEANKTINFIDMLGKEVIPTLISKYDVVSVKESADGTYIDAVLSTQSVSGVIKSISNDDGRTIIKIDDQNYKVTKTCARECADIITVGNEVTLRINALGYVAAAVAGKADDGIYAYMIFENYDPNTEEIFLKMVNANDEIVILSTTDKCIVDGVRYKSVKETFDAIQAGVATTKVFVYKLDEESGKINNIDTIIQTSSESKELSLGALYDSGDATLGFKASGNFQNKFYLTTDSVVFTIYNGDNLADSRKYRARKMSTLGNDKNYMVKAYANHKTFVADAVVITKDLNATLSSGNHTTWAVSDVSYVWDEENAESTRQLTLVNGSTTKSVLVTNDEWDENNYDVEVGDLVRCDVEDGYVMEKALVVEYDKSEGKFSSAAGTENGEGWNGAEYKQISGFVYEIRDSLVMMYATKGKDISAMASIERDEAALHVIKPNGFVKFKMRDGIVTSSAGTINELRAYVDCGNDCSRVSAYMNWMQHGVMYVLDYDE